MPKTRSGPRWAAPPAKQTFALPLTSSRKLLLELPLQVILIRKMLTVLRRLFILGAGLAVLLLPAAALAASSSSTNGQQGIAQSYQTSGVVRQGMLVGLKKGDTSKVVALTATNITDMFGVAIS